MELHNEVVDMPFVSDTEWEILQIKNKFFFPENQSKFIKDFKKGKFFQKLVKEYKIDQKVDQINDQIDHNDNNQT